MSTGQLPENTPSASTTSWWGLIATLGPVLVVAMDGSILFLAIPRINEALHPSTEQSLWILDTYGFVVGSLLITFGSLGDRFGRKKFLIIGATVFGVGSFLGAISPTPEVLIAARALMGLGGATLLPSCLAVISELFERPAQRARAIGIFAATFAAGFVIGPIVGGLLLNDFPWGSVFLVNIPVILLFLLSAPVLLREVHGARPGRLDAYSVLLSILGLFIVIYGIKRAAAYGLDIASVVSTIVGLTALTLFVLRQKNLETPLLDVSLFRQRVFAVAILTGLLSLFVWSAAAYLSMTFLQSVLHYTALHAAFLAVPGAIVLTVSSMYTPYFVERVGPRAALIVCHFSMALGLGLLVLTNATTGIVFYVASTVVAGVGFGISFSLVADTAVGAVPESRAGAAGAIAETSNEIGNALGIALLGSLLTVLFRANYPGDETGIAEVVDSVGLSHAAVEQASSAFLTGFHVVALTATMLCAALGILALRWIPQPISVPDPAILNEDRPGSEQQSGLTGEQASGDEG